MLSAMPGGPYKRHAGNSPMRERSSHRNPPIWSMWAWLTKTSLT